MLSLAGQNARLHCQGKGFLTLVLAIIKSGCKRDPRFAESALAQNTRVNEGFVVMQKSIPVHEKILCFLEP